MIRYGSGRPRTTCSRGIWAILQDMDQPGLEPDRAERSDRHPAEPVSHLVPSPQIVRGQRRGPCDVVVPTDLMLDSVSAEDILCGKCQVSDAQLVPELLGKLAG